MSRIVCNYCEKQGHHIANCHVEKNPRMVKVVWIPKYILKPITNLQGPKLNWIPKTSGWESFVRDVLKPMEINGSWTIAIQDTKFQLPKELKLKNVKPSLLISMNEKNKLNPMNKLIEMIKSNARYDYFSLSYWELHWKSF